MDWKRIIGLLLAAIFGISGIAHAATVRGYTYDLYTLALLNNTVVGISTNPSQQLVAKGGFYEFEVPPGNYVLEASHYRFGDLVRYTQENITVAKEGAFELDLLLEPVGNFSGDIGGVEVPGDLDGDGDSDFNLLLFIVGVGLVVLLIYYNRAKHVKFFDLARRPPGDRGTFEGKMQRKDGKKEGGKEEGILIGGNERENGRIGFEGAKAAPEEGKGARGRVSRQAEEVLDAIIKSEGRIQQRELRKIFSFSEAKMSNLLDELEEAGRVRRIKKGRGNLIKAV